MTIIRPLIALTLAGVAALGVLAAHTMNAQASVEIRQLGAPVEGHLIRDAFGNTIGYEAFPESATDGLGASVE
jgi:hypothetical protein